MNKIQIYEIWKSLDSVLFNWVVGSFDLHQIHLQKKENKTQTNNKCLNNWVIMSQLQLALAMILQVSGSLLQEWNNSFKIHSLICFSDDGFKEHYLHHLSAKT